ncbi:MAG TPA: hypothetical protein VFQ38_20710 [Longimicrobiales bacterium]|nr:hypothetical protein [Longimicrobiales bacterium]
MSTFRVLVQKISEVFSHAFNWVVGSPEHWWLVGVALLVILFLALSVGRKQPGM